MENEKQLADKMRDALTDKYSATLNRWKNWRAGKVNDVNRMDIESFIAYEVLIRKVIPNYAIEYSIATSKKTPKTFCKNKECIERLSEVFNLPTEVINLRLQSRKQNLAKLPYGKEVLIAVYGQLDNVFTMRKN